MIPGKGNEKDTTAGLTSGGLDGTGYDTFHERFTAIGILGAAASLSELHIITGMAVPV